MKEKCSVLISSCDKYSDAWDPCLMLYKKYWQDCPYKIYINAETADYHGIPGVSVTSITTGEGKTLSWSLRLRNTLKRIDTKYVIFMLEDFFLMSTVNQKEIEHCIAIMEQDSSVASINFGRGSYLESSPYDGAYAIRSRNTSYYLNAQAAIWDRKKLIRLLSPYENAWQFEIYGSERAKLYSYKFLINTSDKMIFDYRTQICFGMGIQKGMWLEGNKAFFEREGIQVNFENLGFYDPVKVSQAISQKPKKTMKEHMMRLLFLGKGTPRWSIREQATLLLTHPFQYMKEKYHSLFYQD